LSRIFLLSPANLAGVRGRAILNGRARFDLAHGAALGELFTYISSLYFRGKLAYAEAFGISSPLIITAGSGLMPPQTLVRLDHLQEMAATPIESFETRYRQPLERDARALDAGCEIVLLGSLATPKYLEPLLEIFGSRLLFPEEFVGLGDMSRGGLLLRSVRSGRELNYIPAERLRVAWPTAP